MRNEKVKVPTSSYDVFATEWGDSIVALRNVGFSSLPHDRVLAERLALAFEQGIARLEPLPDLHPCWGQMEKRPGYEMHGVSVESLLERHLRTAPDDDTVRWLCIAITLYYGDNDFASELFRPLVTRDAQNLRWLIAGAVWVSAFSGVDTSERLRKELLPSQEQLANVVRAIDPVERPERSHIRWTAEIGSCVLAGTTFPDMSRADARWSSFPSRSVRAT